MYPCPVLPTELSPLLLSAQGVIMSFHVIDLWFVVLFDSIIVVEFHGLPGVWS
jgi:hypothetical protein